MLAIMPTRKPAAPKTARAKSGLTEIGEAAMRKALLAALKRHRWAFPAVAEELRLSGSANVLRAIRKYGKGHHPEAWKPAPLLEKLAAEGKTFN